MTGNRVMKLWTVIVTAFMAVLATLGFASTATAASVQQAEGIRNCVAAAPSETRPLPAPRTSPHDRTLPPTMKQRIRAEAHGASPSCRARASAAEPTDAVAPAARTKPAAAPAPSKGTTPVMVSASVSDAGLSYSRVEYAAAKPPRTSTGTTASRSGTAASNSSAHATGAMSPSASVTVSVSNGAPAATNTARRPTYAAPQDRLAPRSVVTVTSPGGYPALIQAAIRAPRTPAQP